MMFPSAQQIRNDLINSPPEERNRRLLDALDRGEVSLDTIHIIRLTLPDESVKEIEDALIFLSESVRVKDKNIGWLENDVNKMHRDHSTTWKLIAFLVFVIIIIVTSLN